jgi:DNA-directed RNA polymerase specialized sigma24 family protein
LLEKIRSICATMAICLWEDRELRIDRRSARSHARSFGAASGKGASGESRGAYDRTLVKLAADPRAYLTAFRVTGNRALSEDAVQEAFCQMVRQPPARKQSGELVGYFLNAVRGHALHMVRSRARRRLREVSYARDQGRKAPRP